MWSHKTRIFAQMRVQVHSNDPMCRVLGIWSVPRTARMMATRTIREATPVEVVDIKKIYINPSSIQLQCYVPFDVPSDPPSLQKQPKPERGSTSTCQSTRDLSIYQRVLGIAT